MKEKLQTQQLPKSERKNDKHDDYQINIVVEFSKGLKVTGSCRGEFKSDPFLLRPLQIKMNLTTAATPANYKTKDRKYSVRMLA